MKKTRGIVNVNLFPSECLIPEKGRELFARVAADQGLTLAKLCGHRVKGECNGNGKCDIIPNAEPFPKKKRLTSGHFLP